MTHDMKKTLMRMLTLMLLMMISMGAWAQEKYVTVNLGANNDGKFDNGTIVEAGQEREGDAVTVTLTVTPATGYTFNKNNVTIYATLSSFSGTRTPEISKTLTLDGPTGDVTKATDYTVTVDANLGVWVESATFNKVSSPQKGPQNAGPDPYVGTWYIANKSSKVDNVDNVAPYNSSTPSTNFYLCPAIGAYYDNNIDHPHLTTYQTNQDQNSIWQVVAVSGESNCYYFIHYKTGKYLKSNETPNYNIDTGKNRKVVHLEEKTDEDDDAFKFYIVDKGSSTFQIYPKVYKPGGTQTNASSLSLNVKGDQWTCYVPQNGLATGIIGVYNYSGSTGSQWAFESVADESLPCATPIIKYSGEEINISYPYSDETGVTIYYTTDGTAPTTSSFSNTSTSFNISASGVIKVRAFAAKTGLQNSDEAVLWGSARPFIIQSKEDANYYLVPAGNSTNVNTTSIAGEPIQWTLQNAGASTGGVPYYYLVNSNGKKINFNASDNTLTMNEESADANKFCIIEDGNSGEYFIIPATGASTGTNYVCRNVFKNNGNVASDNATAQDVKANSVDNINRSHWILRVCNEEADQKSLFANPPFSVSNDDETHYYHIQSVGSGGYYIIPPATDEGYATTSNTSTDYTNNPWLFKVAATDNWLTYYYIINAATGKYMYFNIANNQTGDKDNAISLKDASEKNATNEDMFQFIMVPSTTTGACYIVAKSYSYADATHLNFRDNKYYGLCRDGEKALRTTWSRASNSNNVKWTFDEAAITSLYLDPIVSQDSEGNISFSHPTIACDFYYTTDGTDPIVPVNAETVPTEPTKNYTGVFLPEIGVTQIRVKAVAKDNYNVASAVITYNLPQLSQPTIAFDNTANTVTISSLTDATIYYAYGDTELDDSAVSESTNAISPVSFTIDSKTYVKALAVKGGFTPSAVQSATIDKVSAPVTYTTSDGKVKLTSNTPGVIIYYEIGDDEGSVAPPTTSSTRYTSPLENVSGKFIKAIAVKEGWITSDVGGSNGIITLQCAMPVIRRGTENTFTISSSFPSEGVSYYYAIDGGDLTTLYEGPVTISAYPFTVRAIAKAEGYANSSIAEVTITEDLVQDDEYYLIASAGDFEKFITKANTIEGAGNKYKVTDDFTYRSTFEIEQTFTGTFEGAAKEDGTFCVISGLKNPLFNTTDGAVIKNVMLKNVQISESGNVGAIAGEAGGYTRIYNCGILPDDATNSNPSTVGSSDGYCGGLVGHLKDDSRVINCFSYANITGGTTVGGIVGYNQTASTAAVSGGKYTNLKTAVVNCMFYGDIKGGTSKYPVYGGAKMLNNAANGINNYDFYRAAATFTPTDYNCSWPALEENLTRFEYYRYLLNSNRELCGWWVKSDAAPSTMEATDVQAIEKDASLMAKWVLDPSIAPYPILKPFGTYPSVINPDAEQRINPTTKKWVSRVASSNTIETNKEPDTEGQTLGVVTVSINAGDHHSGSDSRTIPITAMDIDNNDFCYGKIQLPYYNEIFGNPDGTTWSEKYGDNYTDMVVTGWDVSSSYGGTNTFNPDWQTGYNFADRNSTDKDSHRVFAQGGYYYVPYGVSSITITAHWANAYYLSNTGGNYERVYLSSGGNPSAGQPFAPAGTRSYESGAFGGQTVNSGTIQAVLTSVTDARTVYDCAIVLVGNYQYRNSSTGVSESTKSKPFTLMTVDLDFDNEPDYCLEWQIGQNTVRAMINPVRFDFLPIVDLGTAMKQDNSKNLYAIGKLTPYGHFEVTETAIIHMGQFEYENENRSLEGPVILNNGVFDQICRGSQSGSGQHINYFIVGGHVKMPQFTPGAHISGGVFRHCAVNVMGGEFAKFFLSGNFTASVDAYNDNPHCYIDGGKLDFVASGGKEQIKGNVFWKIDHAYIGEFYGGGINSDKPVAGSIDIAIDRSRVTKFCGGPQFGDMASGMTVTTSATGTKFGVYYGAGNGGTCYSQYDQSDVTSGTPNSYAWETNDGYSGKLANYSPLTYRNKATGYHAKYELEMINSSAGTENNAVCRTYMYAAQFATTNTGNVSNTLTDCIIETDFFGGGLLGGVTGNVTSTLSGNTVVEGNVYGAGYGIADLTVDVLPKGYTPPTRNPDTAVITPPGYPTATIYYWTHDTQFGNTTLSTDSPAILDPNGDGKNYLYTEISLDNLGTVTGNATLNIQGNTEIFGDVFGGGDKGVVNGSTTVNIEN